MSLVDKPDYIASDHKSEGRPTQADVAALAGVDQPQISNYLRGKIKSWTHRERIRGAIEQLGYVKPDGIGRPLVEVEQ